MPQTATLIATQRCSTAKSEEGVTVDLGKMTTSQRIAFTGAILAAVALFLPWRTLAGEALSAFDSGFLAWGGLLMPIGGVTVLALEALEVADIRLRALSAEQIAFVLASLGSAMILVRRVISGEIRWGLYVGLLASVIVLYGAFTAMRDAGRALPSWSDFRAGHNT